MFDVYNVENSKIPNKNELFKTSQKTENNTSYSKTVEDLQLNLLNNSVSTSPITSSESSKSAVYLLSPDKSLTLSNLSNPEKSSKSKTTSNEFLGKKKKRFFFNVINKSTLSSSENKENDKISNNSNSENLNSEFNKNKIEKPVITKKHFHRTFMNKYNNLNEGRWTLEEHIRFVEAIIQYGKDWKQVQKLVRSRSSAQARSHAQKFFLKLKTVKLPELFLDFTGDNIKNLQNMIDKIEEFEKKKYGFSDKLTTINILLNLSEQYFRDKTNNKNEQFDIYKTKYITKMTPKETIENLEITEQKIEENKLIENLEQKKEIAVKEKEEMEIVKNIVIDTNKVEQKNTENEKMKNNKNLEKEDNKNDNKNEYNFSIPSVPNRNDNNFNNEDDKNSCIEEEPEINLDMQRIIFWDDDYKFNNLEDYFLVNVPRSIKKYFLSFNPDKISFLNNRFYS